MVVRILLLPGLAQNEAVFRKKFATIQRQCGNAVEFEVLEPPHVLKAPNQPGLDPSSSGSTFDDPELLPRAWWFANEEQTGLYRGHMESIIYLRNFLAKQTIPFDGILGFSQGASMASLIIALLERPYLHPEFLVDGKLPHQPLRFAVLVSAFKPMDPSLAAPYEHGKLKTPSLHVIGRNDVVLGVKRSIMLLENFENPRAEWHDGGHFVPSKSNWRHFFQAYFTSFDEDSDARQAVVSLPKSAQCGYGVCLCFTVVSYENAGRYEPQYPAGIAVSQEIISQ